MTRADAGPASDTTGELLGRMLQVALLPHDTLKGIAWDWCSMDGVMVKAHICLDKGDDHAVDDAGVKKRRIIGHTRRRGEPPLLGCVEGKPRRWVVERPNSWHNRFRGSRGSSRGRH